MFNNMTFDELYRIFENPLVTIPFFNGLLFIIVGVVLFYFPSKKINVLYGYRTKNSMSSQELWDFSQKYSAKVMMWLGVVLMCSSFFTVYIDFGKVINVILGITLLILAVIILRIVVEKAITKKIEKIK